MKTKRRYKPSEIIKNLFKDIKLSYCLVGILGSAILAFGLYNVHSVSHVTEGGVLGLTLLLDHWANISPSVSGFVLNTLCYLLGVKALGRKFVVYSTISTLGFSGVYFICEQFDPLFPQIAEMPLLAAVVGALFVGIGAGLCVRIGGAPSGDDALAMSLSKLIKCKIEVIYLFSDLIVLALSLTYIGIDRIMYSLLTVILSGQIIGIIQRIGRKKKAKMPEPAKAEAEKAETENE